MQIKLGSWHVLTRHSKLKLVQSKKMLMAFYLCHVLFLELVSVLRLPLSVLISLVNALLLL